MALPRSLSPVEIYIKRSELDARVEEFLAPLARNNIRARGRSDLITKAVKLFEEDVNFQKWFSGLSVNFSDDPECPKYYSISMEQLIKNFKFIVNKKIHRISKSMWDSNANLRQWYCGNLMSPFNEAVLTGTGLQESQASLNELAENFRSIIISGNAYLVEQMWLDNERLKEALINLTREAKITFLRSTLTSYSQHGITFVFEYIDLVNDIDICQKLLEDLEKEARLIRDVRCEVRKEDKIDLLRKQIEKLSHPENQNAIFLEATFNEDNEALYLENALVDTISNQTSEINLSKKSLKELLSQFELILKSSKSNNILNLWNNHPALQCYFTGRVINLDCSNRGIFRPTTIPLKTAKKFFKCALTSQCRQIIYAMWGNEELQAYFLDQQSSASKLIEKFSTAFLGRHCDKIVKAIWENNVNLHYAIKNLDNTKAKKFLKKILSHHHNLGETFVLDYLQRIENIQLIRQVLDELNQVEKKNIEINQKINILGKFIKSLPSDTILFSEERTSKRQRTDDLEAQSQPPQGEVSRTVADFPSISAGYTIEQLTSFLLFSENTRSSGKLMEVDSVMQPNVLSFDSEPVSPRSNIIDLTRD